MSINMISVITCLSLLSTISAHGMLYYPGKLPSYSTRGAVRDYNKIDHAISDLRNPLDSPSLCRGASKGPVTPVQLSNDKDFTLTLAFSNGAHHIGPCSVQILDAKNPGKEGIEIAAVQGSNGCAKKPIAEFETDKSGPASKQCPGKIPAGLITDDMCLTTWSFKPKNVDKITCTDCILRWTWRAEHLGVNNPELYENCADIKLTKGDGQASPAPASVKPDVNDNKEVNRVPALPTPESKETTEESKKQPKESKKETVKEEEPAEAKKETKAPLKPASKIEAKNPDKPCSKSASKGKSLTNASSCNCNKSDKNTPYYACSSDSSKFCVCFPGYLSLEPQVMSCGTGTKCVQGDGFINCF